MEKIKATTQKAGYVRSAYNYALRYGYSDIYEAYKNPSVYKVRAWRYCEELCRKYNGYNLMISGRGCWTFSAVFLFTDPGTGVENVAWITKGHDRYTEYRV